MSKNIMIISKHKELTKETKPMLLEKSELKLLKTLVSSNNNINIAYFLKETNISFGKLDKQVEKINEKMRGVASIGYNDEKLTLHFKNMNQLLKIINQEHNFEVSDDENKRFKELLMIFIANNDQDRYVTTQSLATQLEVSRGTVSNDINKMRSKLKEYQVTIIGKTNKGLKLCSSEFSIRLLILHYLYDEYVVNYNFYIEKDKILNDKIENVEQFFSLNYVRRELFKKSIIITILRTVKSKHLTEDMSPYQIFFKNVSCLIELKKYLERYYVDYMSDQDFNFLCFPVNLENTQKFNPENESVNNILNEMIQTIYRDHQVYFDKEFLNKQLKYHLIFLLNRLTFKVSPEVVVDCKMIENSFPFAYQVARVAAKTIERKLHFSISENEIAYISLYFQLAVKEKYHMPKKIAVVNSYGRSITNLIEERIRRVFIDDCELIQINENEVEYLNDNEFIAIFSADNIEIKTNIPVILIMNIFNTEYIEEKINRAKVKKIINNPQINYFFSIQKESELVYEKNLKSRLGFLENDIKLDADFIKKVQAQKNEDVGREGAFVPHAIMKNNSSFLLDFSIFKSKKKFQFIFLIGIPEYLNEKQENLLLEIYNFVFEIIHRLVLKSTVKDNNIFIFENGDEVLKKLQDLYSLV